MGNGSIDSFFPGIEACSGKFCVWIQFPVAAEVELRVEDDFSYDQKEQCEDEDVVDEAEHAVVEGELLDI